MCSVSFRLYIHRDSVYNSWLRVEWKFFPLQSPHIARMHDVQKTNKALSSHCVTV